MHASDWVRYLFGQGRAIREVAESRGALGTGIGLVLLTAIARNYDQTFIGEKPFLWLFGSLLFSLVSGTWLYVTVYGCFARWRMAGAEGRPGFWSGWRVFMGLFWLTAPIAWLYAVPVERFFDPVTAAKANVFLLVVVSLWRVLLMTRVLQHLTTAPFFTVLVWVLFAAAVEVLVVFFFGDAFAKAIMQGMGGMRNSPAENILLGAMEAALIGALWTAPIALGLSLVLQARARRSLQPFPLVLAGSFSGGSLVIAAVFWVGLAIAPQRQLVRNVSVEKLLAGGRAREALDYLSRHEPGHFAPARTLPPKPYEYSVFTELPDCFDAVQPSDPAWVRALLVGRLDEMLGHYGPRRGRLQSLSPDDQIKYIRSGVGRYNPEAEGLLKLLNGLERIPEGQAWLATNKMFLQALQQMVGEPPVRSRYDSPPEEKQRADWSSLSNRLRDLLPESFPTSATNLIDAPGPAR